jgi:predicted PurR-regulated permease PerM
VNELPPPWRIVLLVVTMIIGIVVVRTIVADAQRVLGWALAATVVALVVSPAVALFDRAVPRVLAIVLTFLLVGAIGAGLSFVYNESLLDQVDTIQESGPQVAQQIEDREDRLGTIAREIELSDKVDELTKRLGEGAGTRGDAVRSAAEALPPYFVSMILTIFLLIFGPRMIDGGLAQLSPERQHWLRPALRRSVRRGQKYVWASFAQAAVSGLAIAVAGTLLDVPAVGLVALFGAIASLVPYVGIVVGWLPVVLLSIGTGPSTWAAAAAAVVAVGLQLVEWRVWRPYVDTRSLHVGPAVPVIAAIFGHGVYGLGGAMYGAIIAVFVLAFLDQLAPGDEALPTPIDEPAVA